MNSDQSEGRKRLHQFLDEALGAIAIEDDLSEIERIVRSYVVYESLPVPDLRIGAHPGRPARAPDMEDNIQALRRFLKGEQTGNDYQVLVNTISILEGIQEKLRRGVA